MEKTRAILETFFQMIKDSISKDEQKIFDDIKKMIDKGDLRKNYYRLKIWELLSKIGETNESIKDVIDSLLTDLTNKWEKTLTKALNEGKLTK